MIVAVLDTCVLFPSMQRDVLLEMAKGSLYKAVWSAGILSELADLVRLKRRGRGQPMQEVEAYLEHLHRQLEQHFPDACVEGWQDYANDALPDPDDQHVVGAAVAGGASLIVTGNLRDFPTRLLPAGISACAVDEFLCRLLDVDREAVWTGLQEICRRSGRKGPRFSVDELIDLLSKRYGATEFAARLG